MKAEVVICGAGIAGVSSAYFLAVQQGVRDVLLVDERPPLSLTSDKSTECYRNWWPGPGDAMVQMMNRSIALFDQWAEESGNVFHLNRRGYLYTTSEAAGVERLRAFAQEASALGAGEVRVHDRQTKGVSYTPAAAEGFADQPNGADLILDQGLIREHFAYLSEQVVAVLHVREAGWLSAQQLGMYLLAQARAKGARLVAGRVAGVDVQGGKVQAVKLASGERIDTPVFINAAGPRLKEVGEMMNVEIPVFNELHLKAAFDDHKRVVGRDAPLLIDSDEQVLGWSKEEQAQLAEDPETAWLTAKMPSGAHARPEGGQQADTLLLLWDYHTEPVEAVFPPPVDPLYPELALRGLCKMVPGLQVYLEKLPKPYLDGGYYTKTQENRPLACSVPVEGAYVIGAMSGYGIMASPALGELVAAQVTQDELPSYAAAFDLARYDDPAYQQLLADWGPSWQL